MIETSEILASINAVRSNESTFTSSFDVLAIDQLIEILSIIEKDEFDII